ncbi:MAG: branched-chain amino acid ABC transporter substrate-binding protein [Deltaproteobacteria bacterium]|nr:branched-chain amino acid ABC transporter substrate-binding protein [Deltaproteobacteria bacterium]
MSKKIFGFLMWAFIASWCLGATAFAADEIKIGLMAPVTGAWASEGQDMVRVVELLADEINTAGGIDGVQVSIIVGDDGGTPKEAALAAQKLVTSGVSAVVGTYGSSVTEASQDIYDEAGVVQVATGSTSIRLTAKGLKRFFRTCPRDDEQGRVLAARVEGLGFKKVAMVHDNTSYSKGLADEAKDIFEHSNVGVVFFDAITPGDRDFNASLTKIKETNPEVIVFTGYYPEAALLLRQKFDMKWNVPMIGGDATNNTALVEIAGKEAASGYYFISPPALSDMTTDSAKKFMKTYSDKYGSLPSSVWSVLAGDAFLVIVEAIKIVGPDSSRIASYLTNDLDFQGLSGQISFNEIGDRLGEVYRLYQVDAEGRFLLR